jgi:tetratricopeptide (TPR) repeat protein
LLAHSEQKQRREQQERERTVDLGKLIEKQAVRIERGDRESVEDRVVAYSERAALYQSNNDLDHAVADYTEAIRLDSGRAESLNNRCVAYTIQGDLKLAIADCTAAIGLDPHSAAGFKQRGLVNFIAANYEAAASDFQIAQQLQPHDVYSVAWLNLAREHAGDSRAWTELRRTGAAWSKSPEWPLAMLHLFLSGGARQWMLAADSVDPCQAKFYAGEWHLLRGARAAAIIALNQAAADSCSNKTPEHLAAVVELTRLDDILRERAERKEREAVEYRRKTNEQQMRQLNFENLVQSKRDSLAQASSITFEYQYKNEAWGYVNHSCLIGATGDVYIYDAQQVPEGRLVSRVAESNYQRALQLAKSLGDEQIEIRRVAFDAGNGLWTATSPGARRVLKVSGESEGQLSDPSANELVKLISTWCPPLQPALSVSFPPLGPNGPRQPN